jgi:hypothetical protein
MNKLFLLIGWYVIIAIGASQNVIDGVTTPFSIVGLVVLLGIPTGVYLYFKYRIVKKTKK